MSQKSYLRCCFIAASIVVLSLCAYAATERGVTIRSGVIYISPDRASAKLSDVSRGREVAVIERTPGWIHLVATVDVNPDEETERNITGWMVDKGIITPQTPDGDKIIFGEAFDSEMEASRRGGRRGAAQDALRMYSKLAEDFPTSPLAGEALYRAADIRWQIEAEDAATRPSAKERDPLLRYQVNEDYMRKVMKKFPHTKWADLAAYHLIDNKLCGDWQAEAKCPEKEAEIYLKYAEEHPQSPKTPEALYKAAWRYSALILIYQTDNQAKKVDDSKSRALNTAKKLMSQYPTDEDWFSRAERLVYMVQNDLPTWGNSVE